MNETMETAIFFYPTEAVLTGYSHIVEVPFHSDQLSLWHMYMSRAMAGQTGIHVVNSEVKLTITRGA